MISPKDIIEMETNIMHHSKHRQRSDTLKTEHSSAQYPHMASLQNRRASVPMEIIIGVDGRPVFNATSSPPSADSPNLKEKREKPRRTTKESTSSKESLIGEHHRSNSKKRRDKSLKKYGKKKSDEKESPTSDESINPQMAVCSIGPVENRRNKSIDILPEYEIRRESVVNVRDAVVQTD